ncbi:MAG TPA: hypothetical protein VII82_10795, partial [Polyangiaceae bacterium]
NEELQKKHVELSWNFIETLTHEFALPAAIASSAAISFVAIDGTVRANASALGLAVRFETTVRRRLAGAVAAMPRVAPPDDADGSARTSSNGVAPLPARPASRDAFDVRSFIVGGAVAAATFTTLGGLARLFGRDRHRS